MGALAFATQLLGALPSLMEAGVAVMDLVTKGNAKLKAFADEKRDPTAEEWDDLNASIAEKRRELHSS